MNSSFFKLLKTSTLVTLFFSSVLFSDEYFIIDVRSLDEVQTGILEDAIHIEWTKISSEIDNLNLSKDDEIFLYCRSGNRSGKAQVILQDLGFTNVLNAGGINEAGKKLEKKIVKYSD